MDNVFDQEVSRSVTYRFDETVAAQLAREGMDDPGLGEFKGREVSNAVSLKKDLESQTGLDQGQVARVLELSQVGHWFIDPGVIAEEVDSHWLTSGQLAALRALSGQRYEHSWLFHQALADQSEEWVVRPPATVNKIWNKELKKKFLFLDRVFQEPELDDEAEHQ